MKSHKGKEFFGDELLAKKLAKENDPIIANRKLLQQLQEAVSEAFIQWEYANAANKHELRTNYEKKLQELKNEEDKIKSGKPLTSAAVVQSSLKSAVDVKSTSEVATARKVFSETEMKEINTHFESLPTPLKTIMEAAMGDDISLDLVADPVYIRREGDLYNRNTVMGLLDKGKLAKDSKDEKEALCPHNQQLTFKKQDIIPCNSIIEAMEHLLNIIKGVPVKPKSVDYKLTLTDDMKAEKRSRISEKVLQLIEKNYKAMEDKHKLLFDIICRDSQTNIIMDDPVLLPDGYIYDRNTAKVFLKYAEGKCPRNEKIVFKEEDITPCVTICRVLDQLNENILKIIKKEEENQAEMNKPKTMAKK